MYFVLSPAKNLNEAADAPLTRHSQPRLLSQAEALMPWRTAIDNVSAGLQFKGVPEKERHEQARHWLSRVGLSGFEDRYPHELSGGMRKRVALAQTLIMDPDIILFDEPKASCTFHIVFFHNVCFIIFSYCLLYNIFS